MNIGIGGICSNRDFRIIGKATPSCAKLSKLSFTMLKGANLTRIWRLRMSKKNYAETDACDIARIHAYRGEIEAAFSWLGRVRQPHCVLSKVDPFFKILRPDPRFKAFLRNMGLPK